MKKTTSGLALYGRKTHMGFTIVELLIVIVVIAILAAISVVAYTGIQTRARDSIRTDTIAKIKQSLELYRAENGGYPGTTANPGFEGWEASTDVAGTFLEQLQPYGFSSNLPEFFNTAQYRIRYYNYPAGATAWAAGCDVSKGRFYVLLVTYESAAHKPASKPVTAADCTHPTSEWSNQSGGNYIWHSFEN